MSSRAIDPAHAAELRLRAYSQLTGRQAPEDARSSASNALYVLHELASSPATAADALALLHELQVHQVELELQDESLRSALGELESMLNRQTELYECAPVGCCTVDADTVIHELNLTGADLLGCDRDALLGRALDGYLVSPGGGALRALLARVQQGGGREAGVVQVLARDGTAHGMQVSVGPDPAGERYLVAFMPVRAAERC